MRAHTAVENRNTLSDDWRRWIAENLMLGSHPASLTEILLKQGITAQQARAEIDAAMSAIRSPYFQAVQRVHNRLAKRDWVLEIPAKLAKLVAMEISRRHQLAREDFLQQFYSRNLPVIITGMLDTCPAYTNWSLDYFQRHFAERMVEVQFGRNADENYELNSIAHKRQIAFGEFVELVRSSGISNDFYMTANNDSKNREVLQELWNDVPALPEYLRADGAKQGFFWLGPAGTITPFHHDLTNNFMAQIMGRKRVRLFAPYHSANVYNHRHCFTSVDGRAIDLQRFPSMAGVPVLDCILEPGEILFLPVGWWHFVEALDISVTISNTNFIWDNDFYSAYPQSHDF